MTPTLNAPYFGESFPISELMTRFRTQWANYRSSSESPVTRIASFNLLVVSDGTNEEELGEILRGLKESHPARVIWTKIEPGKRWEDSTARLHLGCRCDGEQICTEVIQLCCGDQPARVASMVLPMIRAGLPTHLLWWNAGPTGGPLFERLADRARLILLDTDDWEHLSDALPRLWNDNHRAEHSFYPLSWFRLQRIRQMIASSYEYSDIELELSNNPKQDDLASTLVSLWLKSSLEGKSIEGGWQAPGVKVLENENVTKMTLKTIERVSDLKLDSHLASVRRALDSPQRDPVFGRIIDLLGVSDLCEL